MQNHDVLSVKPIGQRKTKKYQHEIMGTIQLIPIVGTLLYIVLRSCIA